MCKQSMGVLLKVKKVNATLHCLNLLVQCARVYIKSCTYVCIPEKVNG